MQLRNIIGGLIFLVFYSIGYTQSIQFSFSKDSLYLGKPIKSTLTITNSFANQLRIYQLSSSLPFELHSYQIENQPIQKFSNQSALTIPIQPNQKNRIQLFWLSFAIDSVQKISIPIQLSNGKNSKTYLLQDSCYFARKVPMNFEQLGLLKQNHTINIDVKDSAWIFPATGILLILLMIIALLLRKPIQRYWKLYKIYKEYIKLKNQIHQFLQLSKDADVIYNINQLWKQYFSSILDASLLAMTTQELERFLTLQTMFTPQEKEQLLLLSRWEDQIFYANQSIPIASHLSSQIHLIESVLAKIYQSKQKAIQNQG